ncbi:MAG TPA: hypothetical protein VFE61_11940 [Candidatus Sulfotelmatobacter sp.]|nr:hypothetical protein [Candidatus Sulfotelmatobacter sp.]
MANKISSSGKVLWGKSNVVLFDTGSLQFGEFPKFILDGSGGAVFAWYTNGPALQCFAQHIPADGTEAFPHNGAAGSTDLNDVQCRTFRLLPRRFRRDLPLLDRRRQPSIRERSLRSEI